MGTPHKRTIFAREVSHRRSNESSLERVRARRSERKYLAKWRSCARTGCRARRLRWCCDHCAGKTCSNGPYSIVLPKVLVPPRRSPNMLIWGIFGGSRGNSRDSHRMPPKVLTSPGVGALSGSAGMGRCHSRYPRRRASARPIRRQTRPFPRQRPVLFRTSHRRARMTGSLGAFLDVPLQGLGRLPTGRAARSLPTSASRRDQLRRAVTSFRPRIGDRFRLPHDQRCFDAARQTHGIDAVGIAGADRRRDCSSRAA